MQSFKHFLEETPLTDLVKKHDNPLSFAKETIQKMKSGKLKLKPRGSANSRELVAMWYKHKKRQRETTESVYFDKSDVEGTGAFSSADTPKGKEYGLFLKKVDDNPSKAYVRSDLCRLINHSAQPNLELKQKGEDVYVASKRKIKKDEELFVNYHDVMNQVQPEEIKRNEFVRLYPNIDKDKLNDGSGDFMNDLKKLKDK